MLSEQSVPGKVASHIINKEFKSYPISVSAWKKVINRNLFKKRIQSVFSLYENNLAFGSLLLVEIGVEPF